MTNLERLCSSLDNKPVDRLLTWDFIDNETILTKYGGFTREKKYSFEELVDVNVKSFKGIGLDMTRGIHDPINHWMKGKVDNWIRFFGVNSENWEVSQAGGTAWISKRPFNDLKGLEKNMPNMPKFDEVKEWFQPFIKYMKQVCDANDVVWVGASEGPICDAYTYMDMELFMQAVYDAPELLNHILDCTTKFSSCIAQIYSENSSSPLFFMCEDICGCTGPIVSPDFLRQQALPRWKKLMKSIIEKNIKFCFHTDGRYGSALPVIMEELNADGLHPFERNGCNDIFEIQKQYPQKKIFGNVCCAVTLPQGNVYDVEDETLEIIEKLGSTGNIFIGSSSELHDLVPIENAETMYRIVHEYGAYPIDVERVVKRRKQIKDKLTIRNKPEILLESNKG